MRSIAIGYAVVWNTFGLEIAFEMKLILVDNENNMIAERLQIRPILCMALWNVTQVTLML